MTIALKPELAKLIQAKVDAGLFRSADELVNAAVAQLVAEDDFERGELDALLAVGEAQANAGRFVEADDAFERVRARSDSRRKGT